MFDIAYTLYNYLTVDYTEAEGNRELAHQGPAELEKIARQV
jgi:hypothetical protein